MNRPDEKGNYDNIIDKQEFDEYITKEVALAFQICRAAHVLQQTRLPP